MSGKVEGRVGTPADIIAGIRHERLNIHTWDPFAKPLTTHFGGVYGPDLSVVRTDEDIDNALAKVPGSPLSEVFGTPFFGPAYWIIPTVQKST